MTSEAFLASVPLFAGLPEDELAGLARVLRRVELRPGDVLFRQGDEVDGLHVVLEGALEVTSSLPGERTLELAAVGPGEVLGEVPLLGGGRRSGTVCATTPAVLLLLDRIDFAGLVSRRHPTAFTIRRRIAAVACARLRHRYASLASSLGSASPPATHDGPPMRQGTPPPARYLSRLGFFRELEPEALAECGWLQVPRATTLVHEGGDAAACFVTVSGAVEEVLRRHDRSIRVGLSGPGRAFGYVGEIDGLGAPVTAATRERSLVLVIPHEQFEVLYHRDSSFAFFDAVQRDLMASLRQAVRPQAQLASAARALR